MRRTAPLLVVTGALGAACATTAPVIAPVDVTVGAAGAHTPMRAPPADGARRCTAKLVALDIDTGAGCFLDERISKGDGILTYPCTGDGVAEAMFGEHRYDGEVKDGKLALALTTELDWDEDHCRWQSKQSIRGELGNHELSWSYVDKPIKGDNCSGSCTARAVIDVDPGDDSVRMKHEPASEEEDDD